MLWACSYPYIERTYLLRRPVEKPALRSEAIIVETYYPVDPLFFA